MESDDLNVWRGRLVSPVQLEGGAQGRERRHTRLAVRSTNLFLWMSVLMLVLSEGLASVRRPTPPARPAGDLEGDAQRRESPTTRFEVRPTPSSS
jgi:hypothetical protein